MLAAFVAAGYSLTAEAGVIKIAKGDLVNGKQYVIAQTGWTKDDPKSWIQAGSDAKVVGSAAVNMATATFTASTDFWTVVLTGDKDVIKLQQGTSSLYELGGNAVYGVNNDATLTLVDGTTTPGSILLEAGEDKQFTFNGTVTNQATFGASGSELEFYAYTASAENESEGALLKVGDKYVVVNKVTHKSVELVSADELESEYVNDEDAYTYALWTSTDGVYINKALASETNKSLKVGTDGFELAPTGDKFEANADLDIFGVWDKATATFKYLVREGNTYKTVVTIDEDTQTAVELTEEAAPVTPVKANDQLCGKDLAKGVNGSEYYLIGSNSATGEVLIQKAKGTQSTMVAPDADWTEDDWAYAYWKVTETKAGDGYVYSFVNKAGIPLSIGNITEFYSESKYGFGFVLTNKEGNKTVQLISGSAALSTSAPNPSTNTSEILGLYSAGVDNFNVAELCQYYNTYFDLLLADEKDGEDDLEGNVFEGGLIPMKIVASTNGYFTLEEADRNDEIFLLKRKADDAYIVLDWDKTWSKKGISNHVTAGGFIFDTLSEDNMEDYLNGNAIEELQKRNLGFAFDMQHSVYSNEIKNIRVVNHGAVLDYEGDSHKVTADDGTDGSVDYPVYLTTFENNGKTYLTVNADVNKVIIYAALQKKTLVHGSDKNNNPLN